MTEREELKACKCGSSDVALQRYSISDCPEGVGRTQFFRGICNACESFSDKRQYVWEAIKMWNDDQKDYKSCKCGSQPAKVRYEGWVYIECPDCGASDRGHWSDDARNNWNRRMEQEG